jgi:hypothetical protein
MSWVQETCSSAAEQREPGLTNQWSGRPTVGIRWHTGGDTCGPPLTASVGRLNSWRAIYRGAEGSDWASGQLRHCSSWVWCTSSLWRPRGSPAVGTQTQLAILSFLLRKPSRSWGYRSWSTCYRYCLDVSRMREIDSQWSGTWVKMGKGSPQKRAKIATFPASRSPEKDTGNSHVHAATFLYTIVHNLHFRRLSGESIRGYPTFRSSGSYRCTPASALPISLLYRSCVS